MKARLNIVAAYRAMARARQQFSERELVDLSMIAVAINGWNRLAIAFRREAGTYKAAAGRARV
jgi:alkylhydroperoxidase family enzyme